MRHGERADFAPVDEEGGGENPTYVSSTEHDPNLTEKGLRQAYEAGLHFKRRIQEYETANKVIFSEIRVECSPFLRCL